MDKQEIHRAMVQKIDTNLNNIRESTFGIIEYLIDIRTCVDEILFLKNYINYNFKD
ncbi:MAG: hypothetical protein KHX03_04380 [Clostridium sp.]|nr:hypothetical protein [Clostridium sp.]